MEQVAGGTLLSVLGLVTGEGGRLNLHTASPRSLLALAYLIVFGSLIAFSAYIWLLRAVSPARVSTYAYVIRWWPVFLGWACPQAIAVFGGRTIITWPRRRVITTFGSSAALARAAVPSPAKEISRMMLAPAAYRG